LLGLGLIPLVWLYRSFSAGVQREIEKIGGLPVDFTVFDNFGLWAQGLWAVGCLLVPLLLHRMDDEDAIPAWAVTSGVALGFIVTTTALLEERLYATYDRWHPVFFFTATVPAAFAIATAGRTARDVFASYVPDGHRVRRAAPAIALTVSVVLAGTAIGDGLDDHLEQPYYHVMDDESWERFTWVRDNVGEDHHVFLSHPWRAPILGAMTGMDPHAYLSPGNPPVKGEDYERFARSGGSLPFFIKNDITLVVAAGKPPFEVFETQKDGVHTMDEDIAAEIAEIRAAETDG
jgi:hypothetical protein